MRLIDIKHIAEGQVISHNFGNKVHNPEVEIPKGYERFELEQKEGSKVAKIIGIKGNKSTVISSGHIDLMKQLVKIYNSHGYSDAKLTPMSMIDAFGSPEMKALHSEKIQFAEKPAYWEDFDEGGWAAKYTIHEIQLKKVEKTIGKLKVYTGEDVYGTNFPGGPQIKVKKMPAENVCIIHLSTGKYLVDTTQANTYIRMWAKIA